MDANIGINEMVAKLEGEMNAHLDRLHKDLGTLRTGRASAQLLEGVRVDYYGSLVPLKQVGAVSVSDVRTLEIQAWDPAALEAIEKALQKADLGCSPINDGKLIRLTLPNMTEDRRKSLAKTVRSMSEDFKVKIRNERRDAIERVKKAQKAKEISEDDAKRIETSVQKLTDSYTGKIDGVIAEKEKEIMTV